MDKEAMLAAQRADPHRIGFTEAHITRTLGALAGFARRWPPTRRSPRTSSLRPTRRRFAFVRSVGSAK